MKNLFLIGGILVAWFLFYKWAERQRAHVVSQNTSTAFPSGGYVGWEAIDQEDMDAGRVMDNYISY
jgi:hypothetical protein